jgi:hypothetical protein
MGNPIHFYWRFNREVFVFVLKRNTTLKWILLSPAFALTGILIAYPLAYNFYLSFHSWYGSATRLPRFEGFSNYIATLSDPRFWNSIRVTIVFTILALRSGASEKQIIEAIEVGIEMGGGPATVSARFAMKVLEYYRQNTLMA